MVGKGYIVYMFDKRNYGFSTREAVMDQPPAGNKPPSRSFQVIRDIGAVVDHIRAKQKINKVTLIGWSWGAMTSGYYTSLHSEKVRRLIFCTLFYAFPLHTNLGPGSGLQNKHKPSEFNYGLGASRTASVAANTARWDGEIPVADKTQYREAGVPEAFWNECLATDPDQQHAQPARAAGTERRARRHIHAGDREADLDCVVDLRADVGDCGRVRQPHLVVPGGPRGADARPDQRAGKTISADQGRDASQYFLRSSASNSSTRSRNS